MPNLCSICGSEEPHHVHDKGSVIPDYFTVGRGQTDFDAALSWKQKYFEVKQELKHLEEYIAKVYG